MHKKLKQIIAILTIITIINAIIVPKNTNAITQEENEEITSESYIVSKENETVSRIMPNTKIKDFKGQFNINKEKIKVLDSQGNKKKDEDYIGTGMKIKFGETTYTASVIGDITGNGKIEQIEISKAIKHTIGLEKHQITGVQAISADVSGDGRIDQNDVSILIRYFITGRLNVGEAQKPAPPTINITNGTQGQNEWYTTNVTLEIKEAEENLVPYTKIMLEITGNGKQEKAQIENGKTINLEQDGIYQIKTYTISAVGTKSATTTQTIKIDKTAPTSAELIAKYVDENGENYEYGTTSYQNIYIQTTEGKDETSGIENVSIQATGVTTLAAGTKTPVTLENNGTTEITVTTTNKAGLSTTKNYTITIDKIIRNPGSIITKLNDENGENYTQNTWTNQNVYIKTDPKSPDITTSYKVEGANEVAKTTEPITITKEGISTITIINEDRYGNMSQSTQTVKIDKQKPEKPTYEITRGGKAEEGNEWYNSNVTIKVLQGNTDQGGSGISHTTFKTTGQVETEETRIEDQGIINIEQDGIYNIEINNYDIAGNKSEPQTITIKLDKQAPQNIQINETEVTGTEIKTTITVTEEVSGMARYQVYVDGELYEEITTNENQVNCNITNQTSTKHNIKVKTKDAAGNESETSKEINMERLATSDIDHVEFIITNFSKTKNGANVTTGSEYIISDTSISQETKYIQVTTSDNQTTGELTGNIRIIRKDGSIADKFEYFPEELAIAIGQNSYGSGSTWSHEANINVANTTLTNAGTTEGTTKEENIAITTKQNSDNRFNIKDKKITGTKTFTRLILKEIKSGTQKIPFTIISRIS